jgi:hypothetical protein
MDFLGGIELRNYSDEISTGNAKFFGLVIYLCLIIFLPYLNVLNRSNFEITFVITFGFSLCIPSFIKRIKSSCSNRVLNMFY